MDFPFNDLPDTAVITCCHILDCNSHILYVSHDEEDGMWQFLCGKNHDISEARVVALSEIFEKDSSVAQLANMPCGYFAQRTDIESDWVIKRKTRSDISH